MTERIIIADDHPIFRDGMRRIVQRAVPEAVIHEVGDASGLMKLVREGEPASMLVLDLDTSGNWRGCQIYDSLVLADGGGLT